jgi:small subunit ribosomal protein S8
MTILDPIGDMLSRIRNAQHRRKANVVVPASKMKKNILDVLVREGYIRAFSDNKDARGHASFVVELKYADGEPVIRTIQRVSTPGRRVYSPITAVKPVANGLGINILSTNKGVMSDVEARQACVGGEILCSVF